MFQSIALINLLLLISMYGQSGGKVYIIIWKKRFTLITNKKIKISISTIINWNLIIESKLLLQPFLYQISLTILYNWILLTKVNVPYFVIFENNILISASIFIIKSLVILKTIIKRNESIIQNIMLILILI